MSKANMIKRIALELDETRESARVLIDYVLEEILAEAVESGSLVLQGFGTFSVVDKAERTGRNPQTGEPLVIAPRTVLKFKPSKALKLTK